MSGAAPTTSKVLPAVLAGVAHGSHLCAFYETEDDLIDLLFPFFAAGSTRANCACGCCRTPSTRKKQQCVRAQSSPNTESNFIPDDHST
jgi:hypothetical protein